MNHFTASNGVKIHRLERGIGFSGVVDTEVGHRSGMISPYGINDAKVDALREFFRAEEDERLARWRWPENPDYVVYPLAEGDSVQVIYEPNGGDALYWRNPVMARRTERFDRPESEDAALAYFDAHPEPKPWHDAKPGEIWLVEGHPRAVIERAQGTRTFLAFADPFGRGPLFPVTSPEIRTATPLWKREK